MEKYEKELIKIGYNKLKRDYGYLDYELNEIDITIGFHNLSQHIQIKVLDKYSGNYTTETRFVELTKRTKKIFHLAMIECVDNFMYNFKRESNEL